jgi:hypothetical protein
MGVLEWSDVKTATKRKREVDKVGIIYLATGNQRTSLPNLCSYEAEASFLCCAENSTFAKDGALNYIPSLGMSYVIDSTHTTSGFLYQIICTHIEDTVLFLYPEVILLVFQYYQISVLFTFIHCFNVFRIFF